MIGIHPQCCASTTLYAVVFSMATLNLFHAAAAATAEMKWIPACDGIFDQFQNCPLASSQKNSLLSLGIVEPPTTNVRDAGNNQKEGSFELDLSQPGNVSLSIQSPSGYDIAVGGGGIFEIMLVAQPAHKPSNCQNNPKKVFNSSQMTFSFNAKSPVALLTGINETVTGPSNIGPPPETVALFSACDGLMIQLFVDLGPEPVATFTELKFTMDLSSAVTGGITLYNYVQTYNSASSEFNGDNDSAIYLVPSGPTRKPSLRPSVAPSTSPTRPTATNAPTIRSPQTAAPTTNNNNNTPRPSSSVHTSPPTSTVTAAFSTEPPTSHGQRQCGYPLWTLTTVLVTTVAWLWL